MLITENTTRISGALCQEPGQRPVRTLSLISLVYAFPSCFLLYSCSLGSLSEINDLHAGLGLRFCFLGECRLRYQLRREEEGAPKMAAEGSPRVTAGQGGRRVSSPDRRMEASWVMCLRDRLERNKLASDVTELVENGAKKLEEGNWTAHTYLGRIKGCHCWQEVMGKWKDVFLGWTGSSVGGKCGTWITSLKKRPCPIPSKKKQKLRTNVIKTTKPWTSVLFALALLKKQNYFESSKLW